jgi:Ca-activated chloride channel family protein
MTWLSPERLWLLAAVAALAVAYVIAQRRRSRYAVRFTNLKLLDRVAPQRPAWRRRAQQRPDASHEFDQGAVDPILPF